MTVHERSRDRPQAHFGPIGTSRIPVDNVWLSGVPTTWTSLAPRTWGVIILTESTAWYRFWGRETWRSWWADRKQWRQYKSEDQRLYSEATRAKAQAEAAGSDGLAKSHCKLGDTRLVITYLAVLAAAGWVVTGMTLLG